MLFLPWLFASEARKALSSRKYGFVNSDCSASNQAGDIVARSRARGSESLDAMRDVEDGDGVVVFFGGIVCDACGGDGADWLLVPLLSCSASSAAAISASSSQPAGSSSGPCAVSSVLIFFAEGEAAAAAPVPEEAAFEAVGETLRFLSLFAGRWLAVEDDMAAVLACLISVCTGCGVKAGYVRCTRIPKLQTLVVRY